MRRTSMERQETGKLLKKKHVRTASLETATRTRGDIILQFTNQHKVRCHIRVVEFQ